MEKNTLKNAQQEFMKGDLLRAKKICLYLLQLNKEPDIYNLLGIISYSEKKYLESFNYLNKCLKISKNHYKALNNIALILIERKKYNRAKYFLDIALEINKNFNQTLFNLSSVYLNQKKLDKSIYYLKKIIASEKNNQFALNNLGNIYYEKRDYKNSIKYYNKALKISYENAYLHNNIGLLYERFKIFNKAKFHYQYALKINRNYHDCKFNLSVLLLKMGEYKKGFDLYNSRFFKLEKTVKLPFQADLNINFKKLNSIKKIYIIAEQGYGDIFLFARFGLFLKKIKLKSCLVIFDELYEFMKIQNVFDEYIKVSNFHNYQSSNIQLFPLMSLSKFFIKNINDIEPLPQYLITKKEKLLQWKKKINKNKFNIGIAWQTGIKERSIPYTFFLKLLNIPNVNLISLHSPNQSIISIKKKDKKKITIFNNLDKQNKFLDTAALIANLDLIISIDTSIAHLSASMQKNTWVLLPFNEDWRWMPKIKKSIWYKSARIFRSKSYNNWSYIFNNILKELKKIQG